MIDKRALSSPLSILCTYYRLEFIFLFKRDRAYLSKKALTSKKKGTLGKKDKRFGHFSHYFFLIKEQNGSV